MSRTDWNPAAYGRFTDLRLRPALDLLAAVPDLPDGPIVDLGCGAGAVGPALAARFGRAPLGVDSSAAMREAAAATGVYAALIDADAATWEPEHPPALLFSNAALHWVGDHATLMPRLARMLAPGGCLAVQMPGQELAPSHAGLRDVAGRLFPGRFDPAGWTPRVSDPAAYLRWLADTGAVSVWETRYLQRLAPVAEGHPVRHFTQSTAMRPFAAALDAAELARFLTAYDSHLAAAYPAEPDGSVLFPFRRVFFTLTRPA